MPTKFDLILEFSILQLPYRQGVQSRNKHKFQICYQMLTVFISYSRIDTRKSAAGTAADKTVVKFTVPRSQNVHISLCLIITDDQRI
jgi:hypothetical protein